VSGVTPPGPYRAYPGAVATTERRPPDAADRPRPLDPPMLPFAIGGTAAWALATLVLLPSRHRLAVHGHGWWLPICLYGLAWGVVGIVVMARHDARRRRRRDQGEPTA
jgi:Protein of unknown function (DUF2530)